MGLQARMSEGDKRLYNPSRDVAHNFKDVMALVAGRLEDEKWPELTDLLSREGVDMDQLGEACAAYCRYVASAAETENADKPMHVCMLESGFFECHPAAQVAVLAMIGTCYAGIQHAGVREATLDGEGPLLTVKDLLKHAERLQRFMGLPGWIRPLAKLKYKIQKALSAFKSGS
jgi:hypothetical protein